MSPLMLVLCLFACTNPTPDRFTETRARCGLGPRAPGPTPAWPGTPACEAALRADLGLDPTDFSDPAIFAPALRGAFELLVRDLGSTEELAEGAWVRGPFLDELAARQAALGGEDVGRLVYDFVVDEIRRTVPDRADAPNVMRFAVHRGTLQLHPTEAARMSPRFAAHGLVHEAAHALYPEHVPCAEDEDQARCDADWAGAYGFEVAVADLAATHCADEASCWEYELARWSQATLILER